MVNRKKVSIIVPIFNVEKYVAYCIESLINQTYQNIEIILVNDGSSDSCSEIVDYYAARDQRILPVHKKNGGVSDARNTGMLYASGKYTFFIDGDDWIDHTLINELVNGMEQYNADVVQTGHYYAYPDYLLYDNRLENQYQQPKVLDNRQLMKELVLNRNVKNFAWGKLYKTKLIQDIPFQKGVIFEDVCWSHLVMQRVKTYVIMHKPLYYYYQHPDSIVGTYSVKHLDYLEGLKKRHDFLEQYYTDLVELSYKELVKANLIHYQLLLRDRRKDRSGIFRTEIRIYMKKVYPHARKALLGDKVLRLEISLFNIHPYLYILFLLIKKGLQIVRFLPKEKGLMQIKSKQRNKSEFSL